MRFAKVLAITFILGLLAMLLFNLIVATSGHAGTITASCYGSESGPLTAPGEKFEPGGLSAAHRTLPFGTRLLVRHGTRSVAVTINDRGPYIDGRDLDLSMGACQAIGLTEEGVGPVEVEQVESVTSGERLPETGGSSFGEGSE